MSTYELSEEATNQTPNDSPTAQPAEATPNAMPVRYGAMSWIGEFSFRKQDEFHCGQRVVVQTERGIELGEKVSTSCSGLLKNVTQDGIKTYIQNCGPEFYKLRAGRVLREATAEDVNEHKHLNVNVLKDVKTCSEFAEKLDLGMKIVTAEHLLGGERIVFYFQSETRIDFRQLVKELAHHYQTRIEMRQVGARDEARLVADYEVCGRECCCKNFLKKLRPVSMKMAKLQKSTLDPSKVSGRCGRLRCCLRYEHEGYEELAKRLPKRNIYVETPEGEGVIIDKHVLTQLLLIRLDNGTQVTYPLDEVKILGPASARPTPPPAPQEKPTTPRPKRTTPTETEKSPKPTIETDKQDDEQTEEDKPNKRRRRGSRGRRRKPKGEGSSTPNTPQRESGNSDAAGNEAKQQSSSNDSERSGSRRRRRRRTPRKKQDGSAGNDANQS